MLMRGRRERETLKLITKGLLNKQIAGVMGVTEKTIKVHRMRVFKKIGARTCRPPRLNHPYHLVEAMPCQLFDMAAEKPGNRVSLYHRTNDLFVCGLMPELCWNKNTHQP